MTLATAKTRPPPLEKIWGSIYELGFIDLSVESEWHFVLKCWKSAVVANWAQREWAPPKQMVEAMMEFSIEQARVRGALWPCVRNVRSREQIFGFACIEGVHGHFCYTKKLFRRQGIARRLLQGVQYATFCPSHMERFLKRLDIRSVGL